RQYRCLLKATVEFAITGKQLTKSLERQRDNLTNYEEGNLINHGCLTVRSLSHTKATP
ncbi:hypothetical protein FocTR4_00001995, partial [Fusarium oxysporum f. sp. cubense]